MSPPDVLADGKFGDLIQALVRRNIEITDAVVEAVHEPQTAESVHEYADRLRRRGLVNHGDIIVCLKQIGCLPVIESPDDLPPWVICLTAKGQPLESVRDASESVAPVTDGRLGSYVYLLCGPDFPRTRSVGYTNALFTAGYRQIVEVPVSERVIKSVYSKVSGGAEQTAEELGELSLSEVQKEFDEIGRAAVAARSSDIHMTPGRAGATISFRVNGKLRRYRDMTNTELARLQASVINTLTETGSIKGGYNPRVNQNAVIERKFESGAVRFRYSGLPMAPNGVDATLRVMPLDVQTVVKPREDLGYDPSHGEILEGALSNNSGLVLWCGTTGSGKSTSLANELGMLARDRPGEVIRSVEEPVEYLVDGVRQHSVSRTSDAGDELLQTIAQVLRSDPDVISIGEIRDDATAELAIRSSRTGHLTLSTLHCESAIDAYLRLKGIGVNVMDLTSGNLIRAIVWQALLPTVCPHCFLSLAQFKAGPGRAHKAHFARLEALGGDLSMVRYASERGCDRCSSTGISGRTICAEVVAPNRAIRKAVGAGDMPAAEDAWRQTNRGGDDMRGRTAYEHSLKKMRLGIISPLDVESDFHYFNQVEE